jgi:hypothetical protein
MWLLFGRKRSSTLLLRPLLLRRRRPLLLGRGRSRIWLLMLSRRRCRLLIRIRLLVRARLLRRRERRRGRRIRHLLSGRGGDHSVKRGSGAGWRMEIVSAARAEFTRVGSGKSARWALLSFRQSCLLSCQRIGAEADRRRALAKRTFIGSPNFTFSNSGCAIAKASRGREPQADNDRRNRRARIKR